MTTSPLRWRAPTWRDPRLGIGVLLVAVSVALGSWLFTRADNSVEVYQAVRTIPSGDSIQPEDIRIVRVSGGSIPEHYVSPDTLPTSAVALRTVGENELIPLSALGDQRAHELRPVVLAAESSVAEILHVGDRVDVWVARADGRTFADPELLIDGVEVWRVSATTSVFAGGSQHHVHVLVPQDRIADVLGALDGATRVTLIPAQIR